MFSLIMMSLLKFICTIIKEFSTPPPPNKRWAMQTAVMGTRNWETERLSNAVTEPKGKGGSDIKLILKITLKLMLKGGKVCAL